jgi:hypothetical protein
MKAIIAAKKAATKLGIGSNQLSLSDRLGQYAIAAVGDCSAGLFHLSQAVPASWVSPAPHCLLVLKHAAIYAACIMICSSFEPIFDDPTCHDHDCKRNEAAFVMETRWIHVGSRTSAESSF